MKPNATDASVANSLNRRAFLARSGVGLGAVALSSMLANDSFGASFG